MELKNDVDEQAAQQIASMQIKVNQEFVTNELDKQGLVEVSYNATTNENNEDNNVSSNNLDTDYFLRLVNCQTQIAQKCQKAYIEEGVRRRRQAYQQNNWVEYERIVQEMGQEQETKHEEVLREVCSALAISED